MIVQALEKTLDHFGETIFSNQSRFKGAIGDFLHGSSMADIRTWLVVIAELGAYSRLKQAMEKGIISSEALFLVDVLHEQKKADINFARELVSSFAALFTDEQLFPDTLSDDMIDAPQIGTLSGVGTDGTTWTYSGDIVDGLKHGRGRMVWSDGHIYEGDFVNGERVGNGKYIWADNHWYEGGFANGRFHGKGKRVWPNGEWYEGDFDNDKCHGKGKILMSTGAVYEGDFYYNKRTGKGKMNTPDGLYYEGDFLDDNPHGKGKMIDQDGVVLEAIFLNGLPSGTGIITLQDGTVHETEF